MNSIACVVLGLLGSPQADPEWWSYRPIERPPLPQVRRTAWARTPIDRFILARLEEEGLHPRPPADRRTLIRRVTFDLTGMPPSPAEVEAFVGDTSPDAYDRLVHRLLASPRYGERQARRWLDVVHYGDTHGYDKDKLRTNAWPYRDYVIRSFNEDTPYARFIREQLAGDVLYPEEPRLVAATGFVAAGPWDFIGHVEVAGKLIDGKIARMLDRDDMVTNALGTFTSLTVGCARCHEHKFDPITMEDYYSLQAVFAAVGRANRPYESDPLSAARRGMLAARRAGLRKRQAELNKKIRTLGGAELEELDRQIGGPAKKGRSPRYGYHARVSNKQRTSKWVQVDLGRPVSIDRVLLYGSDEYGWPDFGFPHRYRVSAILDGEVRVLADQTSADVPRPGAAPVVIDGKGVRARVVRVTATKLWNRRKKGAGLTGDWIFALGELAVFSDGKNVAKDAKVKALDSIEAPPRWSRANVVDGIVGKKGVVDAGLVARREALLRKRVPEATRREAGRITADLRKTDAEIAALPSPAMVYAAATHFRPEGQHKPSNGKPMEIRVLRRGDVRVPQQKVGPGTVSVPGLPSRFKLPEGHVEGDRRAALAAWIADRRNPLTWRSIVNRAWLWHFGRGIVETPGDFGRMGKRPTHPELLDWLSARFRDEGQSFKALHRLIVTSAVYRQSGRPRRLEAEEVRDAVLAASGRMDLRMYGPGFRDFVLEHPTHSPHYEYHKHDPDDRKTHRRAVYRFLVRSQPQPFMNALDCADPSMRVHRRDETLTPLQALSLLNNGFMLRMSRHFADRLEREGAGIDRAFRLAIGRAPSAEEARDLAGYAREHGLPNACRVILNLNEFVFVE